MWKESGTMWKYITTEKITKEDCCVLALIFSEWYFLVALEDEVFTEVFDPEPNIKTTPEKED